MNPGRSLGVIGPEALNALCWRVTHAQDHHDLVLATKCRRLGEQRGQVVGTRALVPAPANILACRVEKASSSMDRAAGACPAVAWQRRLFWGAV